MWKVKEVSRNQADCVAECSQVRDIEQKRTLNRPKGQNHELMTGEDVRGEAIGQN